MKPIGDVRSWVGICGGVSLCILMALVAIGVAADDSKIVMQPSRLEVRSGPSANISVVYAWFAKGGKGNGVIDQFFVLEHQGVSPLPVPFVGLGAVGYDQKLNVFELIIDKRGHWSIYKKSSERELKDVALNGTRIGVDLLLQFINQRLTNDEVFAMVQEQDWARTRLGR